MNPGSVFRLTVLSLVLAVLLPGRLNAVEIVAHRGASHDAPENTIRAVKLGWEQGADACEIDIRLSGDGQVILLHDAGTKRTTGVDLTAASTPADVLLKLDAGKWKGPQFEGELLPSLEALLREVPEGERLFIEIKTGPEIVPGLERLLRASSLRPEQRVFISFNYESIRAIKERFPDSEAYLLYGWKEDRETKQFPDIDRIIASAKAANLDGLDLDWNFPIDAEFVRKVHDAGLKLAVYTVDDAAVARRLKAAGVDSITTNRPGWLRAQLEGPDADAANGKGGGGDSRR